MKASRRTVLKWLGVQLALPAVLPHLAHAQGMPMRKRFIGAYVPNGAYMPMGADGAWTWAEALQPLVARNLQGNAMVVRKLFNGFPGARPALAELRGLLVVRADGAG